MLHTLLATNLVSDHLERRWRRRARRTTAPVAAEATDAGGLAHRHR